MHRPPQMYRPKRAIPNLSSNNNNLHPSAISTPPTNQHQILHQPPPQTIPHSYQSNIIPLNYPLPHLQHFQQHAPRRNFPNHIITSKHPQPAPLPPQPQQQPQPQKNQLSVLTNTTNIRILKHPSQMQPMVPSSNTKVQTVISPKPTSTGNSSIICKQLDSINICKVTSGQQIRNVIPLPVSIQPKRIEIVNSANVQPKPKVVDLPKNEPIKILTKESNAYTCGQILQSEQLTNSKEKTPMCLVNELARYNKITHQYRLTGEQGPAHSKRFTVTLKLGEEEYTADGPSIKKAQHTAAGEATNLTKYEHPPPKTVRQKNGNTRSSAGTITPTVELNALAMKLGEPTIYVYDPALPGVDLSNGIEIGNPATLQPLQPNLNNLSQQTQVYAETGQYQLLNNRNNIYLNGGFPPTRGRGSYSNKGPFINFSKHPRITVPFNGIPPHFSKDACKITLLIGKKKFVGIGPTVQAAKHDAAAHALEILKPLAEETDNVEITKTACVEDSNSEIKSPISLVHEMALKRNLNVTFEVKSEAGPPHMKLFITICSVGTTVTEGEGNGKKISKKRAAEKMLEELKKLPPVVTEKTNNSNSANVNQKSNNTKPTKVRNSKRTNGNQTQPAQLPTVPVRKKTKNLIKEKLEPEIVEEINPISKLIQIQQALKQKEPIYTVVEEKGAPRRREFVIEVCAGEQSAKGLGSNKKIAKKNAAKNLLALMGYEILPGPNKENDSSIVNTVFINSDLKSANETSQKEISSTNNNNKTGSIANKSGNLNRQNLQANSGKNHNKISNSNQSQKHINDKLENTQQNSTNTIDSFQLDSPETEKSSSSSSETGVRPKDQLLYLAELLGFKVVFSDYPKGNHGEYLTIVTLSTLPPQICHGAGSDTKASQDKAAITALEMLSKLGLDNVTPKNNSSSQNDVKKTSKVVLAVADSSEK